MTKYWKPLALFSATVLTAALMLNLFTGSTEETKEEAQLQERFQDYYKIFALSTPTEMDFAGEDVPLSLIDVQEKFDRELLVNTYWQSQTLLLIKRSNRWFPTIEKILAEEGVPQDFKYLALMESGLTNNVSPAGATGFWQLMKDAARERGMEVGGQVDERYHIEKSTKVACAYLREAKERFGTWTMAAASYNMGMAGFSKQLKRQKATNYYDLVLNEETSRYIFRILAAKTILSSPQEFGFNFREQDLYHPLYFDELKITSSIDDIAAFAFENGVNYKALKYLNPWLRDNRLSNPTGKTYIIKIPNKPLSLQLVHDKEQVASFARQKTEGDEEQEVNSGN
ncbi:MAG: lytic transglycosylase domain-containing protein [Flavobacteriales bacterium]|nr:lytic transglycosylase domain-containing protein [Flavobacteriales bacterium]